MSLARADSRDVCLAVSEIAPPSLPLNVEPSRGLPPRPTGVLFGAGQRAFELRVVSCSRLACADPAGITEGVLADDLSRAQHPCGRVLSDRHQAQTEPGSSRRGSVVTGADRNPGDWWRVLLVARVVQAIVGVCAQGSAPRGVLANVFHAQSDRADIAVSHGMILGPRQGTDIAIHRAITP